MTICRYSMHALIFIASFQFVGTLTETIISSSWNWYKLLKRAKIAKNFVVLRWKPIYWVQSKFHHIFFFFSTSSFSLFFAPLLPISFSISLTLTPTFSVSILVFLQTHDIPFSCYFIRRGACFDSTNFIQWQYDGSKIKCWRNGNGKRTRHSLKHVRVNPIKMKFDNILNLKLI